MNVALRAGNYISLASGGGGLDLGVDLGAGGTARPVVFVENEATAATLLVHRMETAHLPAAPLWSDLRTFDFRAWRGLVDGIVGGYPCQPFSYAGSRRGADDPRHLWPAIAAGIRAAEPAWCFFENVAGHLSLGFREVAGGLQGMGYGVAAALVTAEEVCAPHRRERLFILAYRDSDAIRDESRRGCWESGAGSSVARDASEVLVDPAGERRGEGRPESVVVGGRNAITGAERAVANAVRERGRGGDAERADAANAFPPGPDNAHRWRRVIAVRPDLAPAVEPDVRGGADGLARGLDLSRSDRLRILGNGVVPQQAAYAWRLLWREFGVEWS